MPVVVDASVIAAIAFGEAEGADLARYLSGQTLLAPALIDYELANIALKKTRRSADLAPRIAAALGAALHLRVSRLPVATADAFRLARAAGLTAYDASYLWLALAHDAELVTLDAALARAADDGRRSPLTGGDLDPPASPRTRGPSPRRRPDTSR
jgi:predicted nucleic acid-binding protein